MNFPYWWSCIGKDLQSTGLPCLVFTLTLSHEEGGFANNTLYERKFFRFYNFFLFIYSIIFFLYFNDIFKGELHHFVQKLKKNVTCDTWHVTCDMWHVTCDTWHVTCATRQVTCDMFGGVNNLSKFQLPSSYCLWFMIIWRSGGKGSLT